MKFLDLTGLQYFYDKYLRPLKDAAFKNVANNLTTTESGFVLDARQGKELDDKITELNGNIETGGDPNEYRYYVRFKKEKLQICYGSFWATMALNQNGSGYTGVSNSIRNGSFAKEFSTVRSLIISRNSGDWATILSKSANSEEITQVVLGYWGGYTSREFAFDYVAIGTYTD